MNDLRDLRVAAFNVERRSIPEEEVIESSAGLSRSHEDHGGHEPENPGTALLIPS
jgi:hypothetical protein